MFHSALSHFVHLAMSFVHHTNVHREIYYSALLTFRPGGMPGLLASSPFLLEPTL
jgi:hypothetical protein